MKKQTKFLLLSFLLITSRFYDVYTTYLYIPDLKGETNVLVSFLGAGWPIMLFVQILFAGLIIYGLYFYYFKFRKIQPAEKDLNLKQYVSFLHFNDRESFIKVFYALPKNKTILLANLGYVASMTLIVSGFIIGSSTLLLLISEKYKAFYQHGIPALLYCIIILLAAFFTYRFYTIEYHHYKKNHTLKKEY